ncbi:hypothetical protein [Geobacter sp.]|uniref:hypothetical protein n=1 Tax=Geobacter sp. TaxID=46610 RepID=UPI00262CB7A5|nr:hypothetical protein [Geobacter sp.]
MSKRIWRSEMVSDFLCPVAGRVWGRWRWFNAGAWPFGADGGVDIPFRQCLTGGNVRWTTQFGTSGDDAATGVTVTPAGEVTVCGYTNGTFAGAASAGGTDIFVARFAAAMGNVLISPVQVSSAGNDFANAVTADGGTGEFYVTGFTDGTLPGAASAGGTDALLVKFALDGTPVWIRQFGTSSNDRGFNTVYVSATSRVHVAGETFGGLDGRGGSSDAFLTVHDSVTGNRL